MKCLIFLDVCDFLYVIQYSLLAFITQEGLCSKHLAYHGFIIDFFRIWFIFGFLGFLTRLCWVIFTFLTLNLFLRCSIWCQSCHCCLIALRDSIGLWLLLLGLFTFSNFISYLYSSLLNFIVTIGNFRFNFNQLCLSPFLIYRLWFFYNTKSLIPCFGHFLFCSEVFLPNYKTSFSSFISELLINKDFESILQFFFIANNIKIEILMLKLVYQICGNFHTSRLNHSECAVEWIDIGHSQG